MFSWFKDKKKTFKDIIEVHNPVSNKKDIEKGGWNCLLAPAKINTKHILVMEED